MSAHFCAAIPNFRIMEIDINEWVPNLAGSSPMLAIHSCTSRAYCRVARPFSEFPRPANRNWPAFRPVSLRYSSIAIRVWSVSSNRTGLPVLLCRIIARSIA